MPGSLPAPQAGQTRLSAVPQPPQNREPAGFSVPQLGHVFISESVERIRPFDWSKLIPAAEAALWAHG
jgi:hypothetical protein